MRFTPVQNRGEAHKFGGTPNLCAGVGSVRGVREIESLPDLGAAIGGGGSLRGLRLQDLDLTGHEADLLARSDVEGMVVLGGAMSDALAAHLRTHGALVFPGDPHAPVNPYRSTLYQPHELYAGLREHGYTATPDFLAYDWARDGAVRHDAFVTLLRAIHDDSMGDALDEVIGSRAVAGVMGGHALERGTDRYAGAALLGHTLAEAGLTVVTGGGPGAMEAANLGALAPDADALTDALARLAPVPSFAPDVGAWARVALDVHDDLLTTPLATAEPQVRSIGIPTWFYGPSHRTSSAPASRSTSPTRCARTGCSPAARPGSSSSRAPRAPCRRSSRRRPACTTRPRATPCPSSSSWAAGTGPRRSRYGPPSGRWPPDGPWPIGSTSSTRSRTPRRS